MQRGGILYPSSHGPRTQTKGGAGVVPERDGASCYCFSLMGEWNWETVQNGPNGKRGVPVDVVHNFIANRFSGKLPSI